MMLNKKNFRRHIRRRNKINITSYESSNLYVKIWRTRWYLYAIFLHIINYMNVTILIDFMLRNEISFLYKDDSKKLKKNWILIKKHIEISKMYKFSTKTYRDD